MVQVQNKDKDTNYRQCPACGTHFVGQGTRAVGTNKHAPILGNVHVIQEAVSTNVLDG